MDYHVFSEPWLQAERLDGNVCHISVMECLTNGHSYRRLRFGSCDSMAEFAAYRLLFSVYLDAILPERYDYEDYLSGNDYDAEKIVEYIGKFDSDVFDDIHPFMQAPVKCFKGGPTGVSAISPFMLRGNNRVFAAGYSPYAMEDSYVLTPEKYIRSLVSIQMGVQAGGRGAGPSVTYSSGCCPIYSVLEGQDLYETIVLSSGYIQGDPGIPLWRWERYDPEYYGLNHPGVLTYAFMPARYIRFADTDVKRVFFEPVSFSVDKSEGRKVNATVMFRNWLKTDPSVTVRDTKRGPVPITFSSRSEFIFQYIDALCGHHSTIAAEMLEESGLDIYPETVSYYAHGMPAKPKNYSVGVMRMPIDYASLSDEKIAKIEGAVSEVRRVGRSISRLKIYPQKMHSSPLLEAFYNFMSSRMPGCIASENPRQTVTRDMRTWIQTIESPIPDIYMWYSEAVPVILREISKGEKYDK